MGGILLLNVAFLVLFFKELKLATFDPALAAALGFAPAVLHYALMTVVSVTAVGAFDAVGSLLVVALMIAPAVTAYLITDSVLGMLLLAAGAGIASAIGGYWLAHGLDVSIAGSMASVAGLLFVAVFLAAPERGMIAIARRNRRQRVRFRGDALLVHLLNHEGTREAQRENRLDHLGEHLRWDEATAMRIVRDLVRNSLVVRQGELLKLTDAGRVRARQVMVG
jgi:manganese/zinc/iron transport system permease protein